LPNHEAFKAGWMNKIANRDREQRYVGGRQAKHSLIGAAGGAVAGGLLAGHKGLSGRIVEMVNKGNISKGMGKKLPWAIRALLPVTVGTLAGQVGGMVTGTISGHRSHNKWKKDRHG